MCRVNWNPASVRPGPRAVGPEQTSASIRMKIFKKTFSGLFNKNIVPFRENGRELNISSLADGYSPARFHCTSLDKNNSGCGISIAWKIIAAMQEGELSRRNVTHDPLRRYPLPPLWHLIITHNSRELLER